MNPLIAQRVLDLIEQSKHILLMTDERIDGDTMGSTLGLFHVLTNINKRVDVYSPKPLPQNFSYLPMVDVIRRDDGVLAQESIDLIIVCDCSDGAYLPDAIAKMPHRVPVVSFDHHATNPRYGTINIVEPDSASTADLVWRFIKAANLPMNTHAAQCLLTGITTDTQVFFSTNTTNAAIEAAAELVKLGARLHDIIRFNYLNKSTNFLRIWGLALERLFPDETFGGVATAITKQDVADIGTTAEELDSLGTIISEFLNAMLDETHDVIVVYRETEDGHVKGSTRSRRKNVAEIAERLYGGGGHKHASGFKVKNASLVQKDCKWVIVKRES